MKNRIGLIVEDDSDIDVINEIVKKIASGKQYSLRRFAGRGCGKIQGKCIQWATDLKTKGCNMLILLHDLDTRNLKELTEQLRQALAPCPIEKHIIVIPIREIEAWLLSDHIAIQKAMNLKRKVGLVANPQSITDPKKKLGEIIYMKSGKTKRYINSVHNKKIAAELNLDNVRRCSSFAPLEGFLSQNIK